MLIDTAQNEEAFLSLLMRSDIFGSELTTWVSKENNNIFLQELKRPGPGSIEFDNKAFLPIIRTQEPLVFIESDYKLVHLRTFVNIENEFFIVLNPEYLFDGVEKAVRYRADFIRIGPDRENVKAISFFGGKLGTQP